MLAVSGKSVPDYEDKCSFILTVHSSEKTLENKDIWNRMDHLPIRHPTLTGNKPIVIRKKPNWISQLITLNPAGFIGMFEKE